MPPKQKSEVSLETVTAATVAELDALALRHYGVDLAKLLARVNTPLGRRQFSRLLGVLVKLPFAEERKRPPSESTRAIIALDWKDDASLRQVAPGVWQFDFIRALASDERGISLTETETYPVLTYYKYESTLGKFIFQAFRKRICGDPATSKAVRNAIDAARKSGVKLIDPTTAHISVGLASTAATAVALVLPASIAAVGAPVVGAIALLLLQVGVDGFCAWSRAVIEEAEQRERTDP